MSGLFSPDKFSSLTLLMSALRNAQGTTRGNTPSERDFDRRLFLVPDAHVSRLQVGTVFRDGAQADGPAVTGIELFASGVRKFLPTILEVHGDAGLGVLIFDGPQPFGDFEPRLQWKAFRDPATGDASANSGIILRAPDPPADLDGLNF